MGDRVAVETMLSCRHCEPCLSGHYHLCDTRRIYSFIPLTEEPGLWGGYAQYMYLHPNSIVHRVDPTLPPEIGVIFNPLGAGFRWAVELPNTQPGDTVVILGPGQRGLASVIACRAVGAGTIIVTGLAADERKLALARSFGANHTIDVDNEDAVRRVKEITNGRGADVVLDVSAYATKPIADALSMVRPGGTIVLAGMKGFKAVDDFVSDLIVMKEINIRGAIGVTSSGYRNAIRLIESGTVPVADMHTHDFALEDASLAIRTLAREIEGDESIHSCLIPPFVGDALAASPPQSRARDHGRPRGSPLHDDIDLCVEPAHRGRASGSWSAGRRPRGIWLASSVAQVRRSRSGWSAVPPRPTTPL